MRTFYFGPCRWVPSWYWVGRDIAEHLRGSVDIRYFTGTEHIPNDAVVFWIKSPPREKSLAELVRKRTKVIYFPVDHYATAAAIATDIAFLEHCKLLVIHADSMQSLFAARPVQLVHHYNKYGIDGASRSGSGRPLWIGGFQYLPYLWHYLRTHDIDMPVDVLTDYHSEAAIRAANERAQHLQLDVSFSKPGNFKGISLHTWSESRQREMLRSCSCAFDYKHISDFNQFHKPPTKIQKYLVSGIPTAINRDSPIHSHIAAEGFEMCSPTESLTWTSASYKRATTEFARHLSGHLSKDAVATRYLEFGKSV
jgi:hypothetical protein